MTTLKKEFTFEYKGQQIKVKLLGYVFCAIFGDVAKPLIIDDGKIYLKKSGEYLSKLPEDASWDPTDFLKKIKKLINSVEL
jgi:hypothetical protein